MGKLSQDPLIQHLSHPHRLELSNHDHHGHLCSGCKLQLASGYVYTCRPCNFTLHISCAKMPPLITHPSHPYHTLNLLPTPAYPEGLFNCDACKRGGDGFSYHCNHCCFDLHILCASKPMSVTHHLHTHPLQLTFASPYASAGFSCDVCRNLGTSKQWLYRCSDCEFDAHMHCATAPVHSPPPLQHHHSFPGATHHHQLQGQGSHVPGPPYYNSMHSTSLGCQQSQQVVGFGNAGNTGLMDAALQGFVEGAAQQVGQNVMQSILGGGGGSDGGSGGDGSGGDSILGNIGSSLLSGMLGDS